MLMAMRQIPEERQQQLWRRIHREAEWAREEKRRAAQAAESQSTAVKAERAEDVATGSTQDARATPADAKPPPLSNLAQWQKFCQTLPGNYAEQIIETLRDVQEDVLYVANPRILYTISIWLDYFVRRYIMEGEHRKWDGWTKHGGTAPKWNWVRP